jgi:hypothetical protein
LGKSRRRPPRYDDPPRSNYCDSVTLPLAGWSTVDESHAFWTVAGERALRERLDQTIARRPLSIKFLPLQLLEAEVHPCLGERGVGVIALLRRHGSRLS